MPPDALRTFAPIWLCLDMAHVFFEWVARHSTRLALIHPAFSLVLMLGWLVLPTALPPEDISVLFGAVFLIGLFGVLWAHGVFSTSALARGIVSPPGQLVFLTTEFLCLAAAASVFLTAAPPGELLAHASMYLAYAFFGAAFLAWGIAARAFVSVAREAEAPSSLHNVVWVYWLVWACPIGMWVLRPSLRRLTRH